MEKYTTRIGRAFAPLSLVAAFSLLAGNLTPAYAIPAIQAFNPSYGDYISGSVSDTTVPPAVTPSSLSYSDGVESPFGGAPAQTLPAALSDSAEISSVNEGIVANDTSSNATANVEANTWTALCASRSVTDPTEMLNASASVNIWDTIYPSFPGGMPPPVSGAIILTGTYGVFGANASGSVTLQDIYYVPIAGLSDAYYEYNYSQSYDVPTNPSGSSTFQVQVPFAAAAVVVGFEANATVSTASDASDDYSSSGLDPHFTVVMPDGGTYTSASGVDYSELPGTTIPEPATLTLLGLGLTGLVAKIARRQCR